MTVSYMAFRERTTSSLVFTVRDPGLPFAMARGGSHAIESGSPAVELEGSTPAMAATPRVYPPGGDPAARRTPHVGDDRLERRGRPHHLDGCKKLGWQRGARAER